ncbi:uncharacterized protein LOC135367139 isoform X2 [Ornithodoros turicata]|uniref:uncharacterized protein LOC135367139 isoform X2 n=1 Tax=Ornithodoros turicata TaxID=34597 RepID=UPI00313A0DE6
MGRIFVFASLWIALVVMPIGKCVTERSHSEGLSYDQAKQDTEKHASDYQVKPAKEEHVEVVPTAAIDDKILRTLEPATYGFWEDFFQQAMHALKKWTIPALIAVLTEIGRRLVRAFWKRDTPQQHRE